MDTKIGFASLIYYFGNIRYYCLKRLSQLSSSLDPSYQVGPGLQELKGFYYPGFLFLPGFSFQLQAP